MKQRKLFSILFRVVFVLLKVYGFLPLKYDFRRNRFESCRVSLCYCLVLMLVYGVGMFYVYRNIIDNTVHESSLNNLFMKMQFGLNYFFFMLTISVAIVGRNLVKYLLNILIFLTNIILARSIKLVDNKLLTHILFKLVFVDIFIQIFIIISYSKYDTDSWKFSIKSTLNFTFMWSTAVLSNGYVAICYLIAHLYRQINLQIADLVQKLCNFGSDHSHWSLKSTKKKQLFRKIATELDRLAYLHRDVTTVVQWFVKIFDFSLLVMIVWDFFIVMFAIFYTYTSLVQDIRDNVRPPWSKYGQSCSVAIFQAFQFYYIVSASALVTRRAEKTGLVLNRFFRAEVTERVEKAIEMFTIELLHQPYSIENCGMFKVDFTLMYSISLHSVRFGLPEDARIDE
ncbi:conserved hypothetical protein [Culex quinquefasciatus]|uniref:Gustatory receptor n=1 Tax=Culex quinquefasciatus TaxID=7176 RepID=B0WXR8_CULQU|nr:conserved hypothetical protein [Culex quinquefasciatus]|eukprot:XP_001862190.1 conserved hypothetical protein [Culex quinquefasciatus]